MSTMIYGITIVFVVLKLANILPMSWLLVFVPLLGYFAFYFFLGFALGVYHRIGKKMMEDTKNHKVN